MVKLELISELGGDLWALEICHNSSWEKMVRAILDMSNLHVRFMVLQGNDELLDWNGSKLHKHTK